ncbi:MAG: hypothetical protein CMJ63_03405 [Planctomycetaceae bacterium]|jgi:cyclopropane fatty-acyl-phospholipid synthase-like methyltransferase|nr:hypothetical protein [Planctomycetaceae bacterium]HCA39686.1 hypothetical protein [Phycisphaerales bacterium]|tara:strand:+ start:4200 stop:4868 length:669 start_codon:yes stop_codon:yes gene_type:complete
MATMQPPHKAYDPVVDSYAADGEEDPAFRSRIRNILCELTPGNQILEVGCGPGLDAVALSKQGMKVTAIDLSSGFIDYAKKTHPQVDFRCMDMRAPTFEDASFDGLLGIACFCHLSSQEVAAALKRYHRLLRPGGVIVLQMMDSQKVDSYVVEDWCGLDGNRIEMVCHDRNWMADSIESAGFHDIEIGSIRSAYYEAIPRIQENGINLYVATALASDDAQRQ